MKSRNQRSAAQFTQEHPGCGETQPDDEQPPDAGGNRDQQKGRQAGMLRGLDGVNLVWDSADRSLRDGPDAELTVVRFGALENGGSNERDMRHGMASSGSVGGPGEHDGAGEERSEDDRGHMKQGAAGAKHGGERERHIRENEEQRALGETPEEGKDDAGPAG